MDTIEIFKAIIVILGLISTSIIPLYFSFKKAQNDFENAKNDFEKEKSLVDMIDIVRQLIVVAEKTYAEATGLEKKCAVMDGLRDYANHMNYSFDSEYWESYIDDLVFMTKKVNVNK